MNKFWTVTDANTSHNNSRSTRFHRIEDAITEAAVRIENGRSEAVYILECVKVVKRAKIPYTVEDMPSARTFPPAPETEEDEISG